VHRQTYDLRAPAPGQLLVLQGRLDVVAAADVRLALEEAVASGSGDLVLDLAGVEAVDATGLGVLVGAHRKAGRSGRTLVLRDVPPAAARLLRRTRLDRVLRQTRTAAAWA
jgi:anti-anti-sigma factor